MQLLTQSQTQAWLAQNTGALLYFTGQQCSVCHVLKPKLEAMLEQRFPAIALAEIPCDQAPELAAQFGIFTVPAIVVMFEKHEVYRKAGVFSLTEVRNELQRSYELFFNVT